MVSKQPDIWQEHGGKACGGLHEGVSLRCPGHSMVNLMGTLLISNWGWRLLQFQAFRYTEKCGDR